MSHGSNLTVWSKLLLAAYAAEESGRNPFTAEDLVVTAWRMFPETFGLQGYPDSLGVPAYPDSNRVFAEIMGAKPIRRFGFLRRVGKKMYSLTETGRARAADLIATVDQTPHGTEPGARIGLSREVVSRLAALLGSRAVQKVTANEADSLTFHDACVFWGITPQSSAIELEGSLSNTQGVLGAAERAVAETERRLRHGGQVVSPRQIGLLKSTDTLLRNKFRMELDIIMKRRDERAH